MNYTIAAHPTLYKGTIFRSRLEARWAAFFDQGAFPGPARYEPVDFLGWTPDFSFNHLDAFEDEPEITRYAEVKPFTTWAQWGDTVKKIVAAYRPIELGEGCVYLLGDHPRSSFRLYWDIKDGQVRHHINNGCLFDLAFGLAPEFNHRQERWWAEAGNLTRYKPPTT